MRKNNNLTGAGPGRPKGVKNKVSKALQDCFLESFHSPEIGGVKGLIEWGQHLPNREAYYKLIARLIPKPATLVNVDVSGHEPKIDLTERLTEARRRLAGIRNEEQDRSVTSSQNGKTSYTVMSRPTKGQD